MATITVGFDSSAGAEAALRFALGQARLRDADLHVVHVWRPTPSTRSGGIEPLPELEEDISAKRHVELRGLRAHVNAVQADERATDVRVDVVGVEGEPQTVLVKEARNSEVLVVGTRAQSELSSSRLRSIGRACARHARCPVAVVPAERFDESRAHSMQLGHAGSAR